MVEHQGTAGLREEFNSLLVAVFPQTTDVQTLMPQGKYTCLLEVWRRKGKAAGRGKREKDL